QLLGALRNKLLCTLRRLRQQLRHSLRASEIRLRRTIRTDFLLRVPTTCSPCCARTATGHPAAAPPSSVMNSRRFIRSPRRRGRAAGRAWRAAVRNYIALDSKVLGIELAAHTRRSFNSTDREPIVRQQRRRCFIPALSFPGFDSIP